MKGATAQAGIVATLQAITAAKRTWRAALLSSFVCFGVSSAQAQNINHYPDSEFLTGDWDGQRSHLKDQGFDLTASYTTEPMANVSGGREQGATYTDNIGVNMDVDLDKLADVSQTTFRVKVAHRNGKSLSNEYIDNEFSVQEIFGGQHFHLVNVQGISSFWDDKLELGYGRLAYNDQFMASPLNCSFVNNAFCGSAVAIFKNAPGGVSAYPTATWGLRATGRLHENVRVLGAVYDGEAAQNRFGTNWSLGDNGALWAGEVHFLRNRQEQARGLPGTYKMGFFHHSGEFDVFGEDINGDNPLVTGQPNKKKSGNSGINFQVDQMIYQESPGSKQGLWAFGNLLFGFDKETQLLPAFYVAGLVYEGLFEQRPQDKTAVGVTTGWYSRALRSAQGEAGLSKQSQETVIEVNHNFKLNRGINFQPDMQYVIRPKGTGDVNNALVLGFKLAVQF
ncbi:carbohydrate porin [Rhodovibrionaceae bacterium A322]